MSSNTEAAPGGPSSLSYIRIDSLQNEDILCQLKYVDKKIEKSEFSHFRFRTFNGVF